MGMEKLAISKLVRDAGTQVRAKLDDERVRDYAEILDELPPVKVVYDGTRYYLWDGFHTTKAHEDKQRKEVTCEVRPGTLRDAILLSLGANSDHGLPRTRDDKRRAVLRMLQDEEWAQWLPSAIAKHCRVTRYLIDEVAKENGIQLANSPVERSKGADGKTRNTEKVKESNRKRAEEKRAKAKPEVEKPPTPPKAQPKVTYDKGAGGDGEECQGAPDDGLPVTKIETSAPEGKPLECYSEMFAKGEAKSDAAIALDAQGKLTDGKDRLRAIGEAAKEPDDMRQQKDVPVGYRQPSVGLAREGLTGSGAADSSPPVTPAFVSLKGKSDAAPPVADTWSDFEEDAKFTLSRETEEDPKTVALRHAQQVLDLVGELRAKVRTRNQ